MLNQTLGLGVWQWAILAVGALMVGVSKTGVAGLSLLFVALFAAALPSSKQASGLVLPLLIVGDLVAVLSYRRHMLWSHLARLLPWTAVGVVVGFLALGTMSDRTARTVIGAILLGMTALSYWLRLRRSTDERALRHWGFAAGIGILAGFTTLVANAAGPLMAIYLVAMRLPKLEYVGTAAVFFCLLNLFKLPFMMDLGLVTGVSLQLNLLLAPLVVLGALAGRRILMRLNQRVFEELALGLSGIAALALLLA
jgi:uncharacterized membrane protein YfcA